MSEVDWGSEGKELPKPKKRVPLWVWICGGGCLFALLMFIGLVVWGIFQVKESILDQEGQWEKLGKVLPFDEHPKLQIVGIGQIPGMDLWQIQDPMAGLQVQIYHAKAKDADDLRKQMFESQQEVNVPLLGKVGRYDSEPGKISVQGRDIECLRYFTVPADEAPDETKTMGRFEKLRLAKVQSAVVMDITKPGDSDLLLMLYNRQFVRKRVPDEEIVDFLEPFHIGPAHVTKIDAPIEPPSPEPADEKK